MSKYDIEITKSAENDLLEIGKYISNELLEPDRALKVVDKIATTIFKLEEMPTRHPIVSDDKLASKGIRKFIIDNHIVFYIVNEKNKLVTIIRILYKRRDWVNIL